MIIGVDFDGTLVEHAYPEIGPVNPLALEYLKLAQQQDCKLILWTMRSGPELDAAVKAMAVCGLEFWGVNRNPDQGEWTSSPKAYCHLYIDDAALGCPLEPSITVKRKRANWQAIGPLMVQAIADWRKDRPW